MNILHKNKRVTIIIKYIVIKRSTEINPCFNSFYQHLEQGPYPRLSASDLLTCEGFFIPLQPEWLWYFEPEFGIHTIVEPPVLLSGAGSGSGVVVGFVVELVVVEDELLLGPVLAPVA